MANRRDFLSTILAAPWASKLLNPTGKFYDPSNDVNTEDLPMPARKTPDWIEGFLTMTENTESPLQYRLWTAISVIASAMRRKCYLDWGMVGRVYPNMYTVLVGPSGARKSYTMQLGEQFLRAVGLNIASSAITREALIGELESCIETEIETMLQHSSLSVFSKELVVFLGKDNQTLMADLCDWYDCPDEWEYKTKNSGENEILGVWVNILGATTPSLIRSNLPVDAIGGGLASRCIFVYARRKGKTVPFPFETEDEKKLRAKLIHDYEVISGLRGGFSFTEGFRDIWVDWYVRQETEDPFMFHKLFDGYSSRRPRHLWKLCMIVSASQNNKMILDEKIFARALKYLLAVEVNMTKTFEGLGTSRNSALMSGIMEVIQNKKLISNVELIRLFSSDIEDVRHFEQVMDILITKQFCKVERINGRNVLYKYIYSDKLKNIPEPMKNGQEETLIIKDADKKK